MQRLSVSRRAAGVFGLAGVAAAAGWVVPAAGQSDGGRSVQDAATLGGPAAGSASVPADTPDGAATARELAARYGLASWPAVRTLEFTFRVTPEAGAEPVSRSWSWDVAGRAVTRTAPGDAVTVDLTTADDARAGVAREVHAQFVNDSYWLVFPFQLVWSDPAVTDAGPAPFPPELAGAAADDATKAFLRGSARKLTAQWPATGGYTPADAYDLYLDDGGLVRGWTFRRGGGAAGRSMTWEGYERFGPLLIATAFRGAGGFELGFDAVKLTLKDRPPAPGAADAGSGSGSSSGSGSDAPAGPKATPDGVFGDPDGRREVDDEAVRDVDRN